jgi:cell wall-associated NlpC family hydrolase
LHAGRKSLSAALTSLCIAATAGPLLVASPSVAAPSHDIGSVRARVGRLDRQAERASERYNDARIDLRKAKHELGSVTVQLHQQREDVDRLELLVASHVIDSVPTDAATTSSSGTPQVTDDPEKFLNQLSDITTFTSDQQTSIDQLTTDVKRLEFREHLAHEMIGSISKSRATLAHQKRIVRQKAAQAKELLSTLEERRQERLSRSEERTTSTSTSTPTASVPVSGSAATAVQFALAQVGKAYVYGAAGPDAYDCSGLTMAAWGAAGVALPHSSSAQMGSGTPVSISDLQPGDLVFYYSPVSHVGMYIGNGEIVNAENPSTGVVTAPVDSMPIAGAVRPG